MSYRPRLLLAGPMMLSLACGAENPAEPSNPSSSAGRCRTFATNYTTTFSYPGLGVSTTHTQCVYWASGQYTCGTNPEPGTCATITGHTSWYARLSDFVDEAALLGRQRATRADSSYSPPAGCSGPFTARFMSYEYDSRGRLTVERMVGATGDPTNVVTTSTAWDGSGRVTRKTMSAQGCTDQVTQLAYDDAQRTITTTTTPGRGAGCESSSSVLVETFDANANLRRATYSQGQPLSTTDISIETTQTVCE